MCRQPTVVCLLVRRVIDAFCRRPGKTLVMVTHYAEDLPGCINRQLRLEMPGS